MAAAGAGAAAAAEVAPCLGAAAVPAEVAADALGQQFPEVEVGVACPAAVAACPAAVAAVAACAAVVAFLVAVVIMLLVVAVVAPKATTVEAVATGVVVAPPAVRMFGAVFERSVVVAVAAGMVGAAVALAAPFERRRGRKET